MKIAINIEFIKHDAPNGAGIQVYALRMAECLSKNHSVSIFIYKQNIEHIKIEKLFSFYKLDKNFSKNIDIHYYGNHSHVDTISKIERNKQFYIEYDKMLKAVNKEYDLFIQANYGILWGTKNLSNNKKQHVAKSVQIMHFPANKYEIPKKLPEDIKDAWKQLEKMQKNYKDSYDYFLCNSEFTQKAFSQVWGKANNTCLLYPPVFANPINKSKIIDKDNIIVTLGKIFPDKCTLDLAKAFKKFNKKNNNYKFIVIGQILPIGREYYNEVKTILKGTNHEIVVSPSTDLVNKYLEKAKFYWHAKGYRASTKFKLEHFGMSTVEAMAKGCVPIVLDGGGQIEIVKDGCGYRWETLEQLINYTEKLINDDNLRIKMAENSVARSQNFNIDSFDKNINKIINSLF